MNENEFEFDGKKYSAKRHDGCEGCAFDTFAVITEACLFAKCHPSQRADGEGVIFVEVQDERAKG